MPEMIDNLNRLGLTIVNSVSNGREWMLACRTKNNNLVVVSYVDLESTGLVYTLDLYNCATTNCFYDDIALLAALKNYLA